MQFPKYNRSALPKSGDDDRAPRCIIKIPQPKTAGDTQFYGGIPKKSATFAWSELCATPDPEASLAPSPQVPQKTWYNTYMYHPAQHSHAERQFMDRFVQGPDGEWLDVVKAKRMAEFYEEKRLIAMKEQMERELIMEDAVVQKTSFTDAYSGEPLVACGGELLPRRQILDEFDIHNKAFEAKLRTQEMRSGFDFDNLRTPWPFGHPHRNKRISKHTYDWFDRANPYIEHDRDVQIVETASTYLDRDLHERFQTGSPMYAQARPPVQHLQL
jgi:hypothetical protein